MQKRLSVLLTEEEIAFLVSVMMEKSKEAGERGDISRCCDIRTIADKIESAAKFA